MNRASGRADLYRYSGDPSLAAERCFATGVAPRHEEDVSGIWEGWQAYSALLVMSCDGVLGKAFKAHPVAKESPRPDWRDAVRPSAYPAAGAIPQRHREA